MSYQVLARKWRPSSFSELVGQEHVLKALVNALDNDRLHHAYLFTGTRGVGKTTIARILAKCLNCEQGVSSTPCGECAACREIAEGRFVDLIEVDAASRTKVEDTRELLDNVQYMPTRGRFKVYLIDEVHMLSGHSFNALLKTLEEPPPHVKFLLATTDPQKLPVTILSRCLQFNLKNLSPERIVGHLKVVLEQEQVPAEESGIWALARAADGSMRDALSLTDQAIAFGDGQVTEAEVSAMLGTINHTTVESLANALAEGDMPQVMAEVSAMAEHAADFQSALSALLSLFHRLAIYQEVPDAVDNSAGDLNTIQTLASQLSKEDVQLYYQIGLMGVRDLPLAPDPRSGFEMALLRMNAFRPEVTREVNPPTLSVVTGDNPQTDSTREKDAAKKFEAAPAAENADSENHPNNADHIAATVVGTLATPESSATLEPSATIKPRSETQSADPVKDLVREEASKISSEDPDPSHAVNEPPAGNSLQPDSATSISLADLKPENWIDVYQQLPIGGLVQNTAANMVLVEVRDKLLRFELDDAQSALYDDRHQARVAEILSDYFGEDIAVDIEIGKVKAETPQAWRERIAREKRAAAIQILESDPSVQLIKQTFNAELIHHTVRSPE